MLGSLDALLLTPSGPKEAESNAYLGILFRVAKKHRGLRGDILKSMEYYLSNMPEECK
jgi:hypothetical protein